MKRLIAASVLALASPAIADTQPTCANVFAAQSDFDFGSGVTTGMFLGTAITLTSQGRFASQGEGVSVISAAARNLCADMPTLTMTEVMQIVSAAWSD